MFYIYIATFKNLDLFHVSFYIQIATFKNLDLFRVSFLQLLRVRLLASGLDYLQEHPPPPLLFFPGCKYSYFYQNTNSNGRSNEYNLNQVEAYSKKQRIFKTDRGLPSMVQQMRLQHLYLGFSTPITMYHMFVCMGV